LVHLVNAALDSISKEAWVGGIALTLIIVMVLVAALYLGKAVPDLVLYVDDGIPQWNEGEPRRIDLTQ
jgi:hypothetical protein